MTIAIEEDIYLTLSGCVISVLIIGLVFLHVAGDGQTFAASDIAVHEPTSSAVSDRKHAFFPDSGPTPAGI